MAAKANKGTSERLITYRVIKAHDGLNEGEIIQKKEGHAGAEYCVQIGLWEKVTAKKGK